MQTYNAKTLDDALALAAEEKQCDVKDLTYFVIEEKKGILGIGANVKIEAYCQDDIKEFLFDYLGNFFTGIGQDIEVGIEETDTGLIIHLNAENNAVLIGAQGRTLSAINTVVRSAVNSEFRRRVEVLVDVNHYKLQRYEKVQRMAKRLAKEVLRSHVDVELDPQPADERKAIHRALNSWDHIRTVSKGQGAERHLCIQYVENKDSSEEEVEEFDEE